MFTTYAKAVVAAIVSGLAAAALGADDNAISMQEGIGIAVAFFTALGAVWATPNKP